MRTPLGIAVALALTFGMALCSGLPYRGEGDQEARIRLSWRAALERVEECRVPTEAELAALPPHMRLPKICEGRTLPFRLEVTLNGQPRFEDEIHAGGVRADRPAYVFRELRVAPGRHHLRVRFGAEGRPPLVLDQTVALRPRDVLLVTHAPDADRLHLVGSSADE